MKVAVRIVGLLLVLIASLGKPALAAGPAPTVISPKGPATLLLRPTVTGYGPAPCVEKGAMLTVDGSSFGDAPAGKQAVLAGRDFSLVLEGKSWTSKAVAVVVPKDPRLVPGELYAIGIQDGSGKWISNIDKTFRICLPQPAATQPAGGSAAIVKSTTSTPIKVPAAAPASAAGAVGGSPAQPSATPAAGSGTPAGTGKQAAAPVLAPSGTVGLSQKVSPLDTQLDKVGREIPPGTPASSPGPSAASTVVQKQVTPAVTSPSQLSGSTGTGTTPPVTNRFQPKAVRTGEISMTGAAFSPKAVRTNEISMTGAAFQPKAVRTNEITMTGAAFSPKAVRTGEVSMTGAAFQPKAVRTGEISMTGAAFSPKAVRTEEITMTGPGSQTTPVMP